MQQIQRKCNLLHFIALHRTTATQLTPTCTAKRAYKLHRANVAPMVATKTRPINGYTTHADAQRCTSTAMPTTALAPCTMHQHALITSPRKTICHCLTRCSSALGRA
eukprot:1484334-Lingulodinium_polyedra.AAC.1